MCEKKRTKKDSYVLQKQNKKILSPTAGVWEHVFKTSSVHLFQQASSGHLVLVFVWDFVKIKSPNSLRFSLKREAYAQKRSAILQNFNS